MAFTGLADSLIAIGKAIKKEIFSTIQSDLQDHEDRLVVFEGAAKKVEIFDGLVKNASSASTLTGLTAWRVTSEMTLLDAKVGIFLKGSLTGTLEIDVRKATSLDDTSAVTVFTTRPKITFSTASNYDESANMVLDLNNKELDEGDWLFLDVTSMPAGGVLGKFSLYLIGEV